MPYVVSLMPAELCTFYSGIDFYVDGAGFSSTGFYFGGY